MGLNSPGLGGQWGAMDKVCSARGEGGLARHRQEWRKPPSGRRVRQHGVLHIVFSGKSPLWILCVYRRVANQSRFPRVSHEPLVCRANQSNRNLTSGRRD